MKVAGDVFDLTAYLRAERRGVEAALSRLSATLLAGVPATLREPLRYALEAGGKRLRPILCVAAYRAVAARPRRAIYDVACGLELVHTYSLMHDDLPCMDDDDLRRGRPTTHRVYGEARATLAGAALIPLACAIVEQGGRALGLGASARAELVRELCAAAGAQGMVGGQLLDLEGEGRQVGIPRLEEIHRRKTGALLTAALRVGGLAGRGQSGQIRALTAYGRAVGLAFQVTDDILDVTGRSAVLGKTAGRDEELAKSTFPAQLGVGEARRRARAEAEAGIAALRRAGIATPELEALARYAVERDR
ncbi:MAG: polyprenyl synthetase family protein [Gemmatimonadetes bacterium]|nr:polyprenyl synthetase family protein [Gemmatimonadota bacterium]